METLLVNHTKCEVIYVNGVKHIIIKSIPKKLYLLSKKNKGRRNNVLYCNHLKSVCEYCDKEFFHVLSTPGKFCSYYCRGKINAAHYIHSKRNITKEKNILKYYVRYYIMNLIKSDKIIRPKQCSACNIFCTPDAHHEDYNKPYEIMWLCRTCHSKLHHGHDIKGRIEVYQL